MTRTVADTNSGHLRIPAPDNDHAGDVGTPRSGVATASRRQAPDVTVVLAIRSSHILIVLTVLVAIGALSIPLIRARPAGATPHPAGTVDVATAAGLRALRLVSFDPSTVDYRLIFRPARRDVRGQTDPARRTITLFISTDDAPHLVAHDIAHELGHAFDARFMDARQRTSYLVARHSPGSPWWPGTVPADYTATAVSDYASGAGDFAEVFALCHAPSPEFRSTMAPRPPDPCQLVPTPPAKRP